jgi:hypothetical protein
MNRTKVDSRTNVICPTRALFGSWTVEKQQCLQKEPIKNQLHRICNKKDVYRTP